MNLKKLIPLVYGQFLNLIALLFPTYAGNKALYIFAKVRKGKLQSDQIPKLLQEGLAQKIKCNGHTIQSYHWKGSGPSVLLLHGWESNTNRWRNLIKVLRDKDFDIHAIDAPAHGLSSGEYHFLPNYAAGFHEILQKHEITHVIGHSMGGMACMYEFYHHEHPTVKSIMTMGSPCDFSLVVSDFQSILKFNSRVLKALDKVVRLNVGYHIDEFSSAYFCEKIPQKGYLFHDEKDRQIPISQSEKLHQHWKNSELIKFRGFGHSLHQKEVIKKIVALLEEKK